jgi:hypothetical protein
LRSLATSGSPTAYGHMAYGHTTYGSNSSELPSAGPVGSPRIQLYHP